MALFNRYKSTMHGNYWGAIFKFGLFMGFGLAIVVMLRSWLKIPLSEPVSYTENFALLIFMLIGVYLYKRGLEEKKITFKESYMVALGSGVVASIIYGIFLYVYAQYLDTELQQRCFDIQRSIKSNAHLSDEQIMYMAKPSSIALSAIMLSSVVSILWALFIAILLRNEKGELVTKEMKNLEN